VNYLFVFLLVSAAALVILFALLVAIKPSGSRWRDGGRGGGGSDGALFVYCAAGMRYPMEEIASAYRRQYDRPIQLQYGGSNTLLGQLDVARTGDLYLAADESYTRLARQKGLVKERLPLASMRPVIVVPRGNPLGIQSVADLLTKGARYALGDPGAAAVGKKTRSLLSVSGQWEQIKQHATVLKPTVNDVAIAVQTGSVDAGIVWDSTVIQYPDLVAIHDKTLDQGTAIIEIAVTEFSKNPTAALHFARYVASQDRGLASFAANGFTTLDGDRWDDNPKLTFFSGAVNRRAIDRAIREFEIREGVTVNTVYNGCGILTAQMKSISNNQAEGFPDTYMACDVYYMDAVKDLFEESINLSDTDIVLVLNKDNPKNIQSLRDLTRPGVRVALGQPRQCTIGVLSRRLLESEGLYQPLARSGNIVSETSSSALLIPNITTGAADAVLAYRTDTVAEKDRLSIIDIDSPLAKAIQTFSISRSSDYKHLGRRLFDVIAASRNEFIAAGFNWRYDPTFDTPAAAAIDRKDTDKD
jgi:molybdenum ABC transporter molybdate-binding protein